MKKLLPLTESEQDLAEEQHDLVYKFLRCKGLPDVDYYDIAIFGFLEAVQKQCRNPISLERQNFCSFAFGCMTHAVGEDAKYRRAQKRRGEPLSLDYAKENASFYEILPGNEHDPLRIVENRDLIGRSLSVGTKREIEAIGLYCKGYELQKISEVMGITYKTCRTTLSHFRRKARAVRNNF